MLKKVMLFLVVISFVTSAQDLNFYITKGDSLFKLFDNKGALEIYQKGLDANPESWEMLWRISRCYVDIGEHLPNTTDEEEAAQIEMYNKALDFAEKAVKAGPEKSVTYLRRAVANGRIALFKGVFSVADVVNQIKADCEKAIELNNGTKETMGITHYVLARTHGKISEKWAPARSVLGLGWAEYDIAVAEFKKAQELYPGLMMIHLDYAKTLIREDEYEEALKALRKAESCNLLDEDDEARKEEVAKLIKEVEEELN